MVPLRFVVMLSAFVSYSVAMAVGSEQYVICKLRGEARALRVEKTSGEKCRATYSKMGNIQNIGEAQYLDSCKAFVARTRTNLEQADWKCRDVGTATVTEAVSESQ